MIYNGKLTKMTEYIRNTLVFLFLFLVLQTPFVFKTEELNRNVINN